MRKHGGTPSRRDKHVSPPGVAWGRFVGGQQSGLVGSKPPPLFTRGASSCSSQGRRQGEPWGASPRPSAPTYYLPTCKIPNSFVNSVPQRLTAYLNAERVYVPWVRWCAEPTCAIQAHWPRRGVPNFPPSLLIPKGSNHYKQVLVSVLLVLTQQGPLKAGFKRKLSELIPQRSVLEEQREADTLRNVRRRLENMQ